MFEDLSEKYTDVLSLQTPPFISIWQKASASMDSSGKQIEEQGQHPTWAQATILMAWHGNDATFRSWEYCTSSITKKAPWISPFFSSKYEEASWSWCFWVIWVERKKKGKCLSEESCQCLFIHETMPSRWPGLGAPVLTGTLPRLSSSPASPFISQLTLLPPPAFKNYWYSFHTEKEQLLSQHKADFGSVAFQKPQAHDFIYPQHD